MTTHFDKSEQSQLEQFSSEFHRPLLDAARRYDVTSIKNYIMDQHSLSKDPFESKAFHYAMNVALNIVSCGNQDCVRELIQAGADVNSNQHSITPLHVAVYNLALDENLLCIKELIKAGADVHAQNENGDTPLHWAARYAKPEALLELIQAGADIHAQNKNGDTPLHLSSAKEECEPCFHLLIKAGANIHAKNQRGDTPLHIASFSNVSSSNIVPELIQLGADVNAQDSFGNTPIYYVAHKHPEDVIRLLKAGADLLIRNKENQTPIDFISQFISSTPTNNLIIQVDEKGNSPLSILKTALIDQELKSAYAPPLPPLNIKQKTQQNSLPRPDMDFVNKHTLK